MSVGLASVLVLWLLVVSRVPAMVRRRYDSVFWVAITAAFADTVNYPPMYAVVDGATGNVNVASLIAGSFIMLSFGLFRSAIIRAVVDAEDQPRSLHRGMMQTSIAITVFVVSFFCALILGDTSSLGVPVSDSTDAGNRSDIGVFVFMVTMSAFLILVSVEIIRVCLKYVPAMASQMFRAGFRLVTLGCTAAVVALTAKIARQTLVLIGYDTDAEQALQAVYVAFQNVTALLIAAGLFLPAASSPLSRLRERHRLLTLQPIWSRAAEAAPALVNRRRPPVRGAFGPRPGDRLHRAVVEILDCQMAEGGVIRSDRDRRLVERAEQALHS